MKRDNLTEEQAKTPVFEELVLIRELKHYLPAQAPLKDFIHHNTLHAFQHQKFKDALCNASGMFGYKVSLSPDEYRSLYDSGKINKDILERTILKQKGNEDAEEWLKKVRFDDYENSALPKIGGLRSAWKRLYQIDLDSMVHPLLFRILCSYLDQGVSIWSFPVHHKGFVSSIREIERRSFTSYFKTKRAKKLLLRTNLKMESLLKILVGDEKFYKQYLFDQQFTHPGWSGMVSYVEDHPHALLDHKKISLLELIFFELLLEIDALEHHLGDGWLPLSKTMQNVPPDLFAPVEKNDFHDVLAIWQEAFEWSYYDQVLAGIRLKAPQQKKGGGKKFQAVFCIDDREFSLQHYLEQNEPTCETFSTPGFFNVEFFYQPLDGKFLTKLCPDPVTPNFLIKEISSGRKHKRELHFAKRSHTLLGGWLITQTLGFWSAVKLFVNIFKPSASPATTTSFTHMDKISRLTIECKHPDHKVNGLQVGFTAEEMAARVEGLLKSIGLIKDFAPIVYVVGHGASSVNNPHYAAYDCGACSGRPGSVNARVFSSMANHADVRRILESKGIIIPEETRFIGALHDTTRDEITFYDEDLLSLLHRGLHSENQMVFETALSLNSKERSRRFELINTRTNAEQIHHRVKLRSVSLFEPRPELNHATNSLCIVGRRALTKNLFLDRRAFLNSYDYSIDPDGHYLQGILNAVAPVCGGINLEYFFSRVDNQKLGAGTKLPHNVMGLFGVANGIDGDLRPGLPIQMIEVHDPVRLLILIEHDPKIVLQVIQKSSATYEWFINEWVHLVVLDPASGKYFQFNDGALSEYQPFQKTVATVHNVNDIIESSQENIPVYIIN